jgi:hypothetical protein
MRTSGLPLNSRVEVTPTTATAKAASFSHPGSVAAHAIRPIAASADSARMPAAATSARCEAWANRSDADAST